MEGTLNLVLRPLRPEILHFLVIIFVENPLAFKQNLTATLYNDDNHQRSSRGHKARNQGHKKNPRPKTAVPRTDPF